MARGTVIIAADQGYLPGLRALLRSFAHYHDVREYRVLVVDAGLDAPLPDWVERVPVMDDERARGPVWAGQYPRYRVASYERGPVLLLDADMYCARSFAGRYLELASQGWVVGAARGMNVRYGDARYGGDLVGWFNPQCVCNVPSAIDAGQHWRLLRSVYDGKLADPTTSDLDLWSVALYRAGLHDRMLVLPCAVTTGVHHYQVKLDTGVEDRDGHLMTRDGQLVDLVHGQWWRDGWVSGLMDPMPSYARTATDIIPLAERSRDLLLDRFLSWAKEDDDGI